MMKARRYIVAIGSNIDPQKNIAEALSILRREQKLLGSSALRMTKPVGYQNQDDFLNGAAYIESPMSYESFRSYLKDIERRLKRVKGPWKSGPRTIDLDIITCDNKLVDRDYHTASYIKEPVQEILREYKLQLLYEDVPSGA